MPKAGVDTHTLITSLPLSEADRAEFIETAKRAFENVIERMEPDNEGLTRALWDPAHYVDHLLLKPDMLPISRDYALSLIDAFLVHHVIDLAEEADNAKDSRIH